AETRTDAYIINTYYYPTSKSLGQNAIGMVLLMNRFTQKNMTQYKMQLIATSKSNLSMATTPVLLEITPHDNCLMLTVFATLQLLPDTNFIAMVSRVNMTIIPFKTPSYQKRNVVVCISPLYVTEQWQNFLLVVHIYKKFGAHMHLYFISAVTSFFELMWEYQKHVGLSPWDRMMFPFVPGDIADAYSQVEFQNLAAAQTDCLLQYKESAQYVALFELSDILIPKLAPTFIKEFQILLERSKGTKDVAYFEYQKHHYEATVYNHTIFRIEDMIRSLVNMEKKTLGNIVIIPEKLNYTWMDRPFSLPGGLRSITVEDNEIIHLANISWVLRFGIEENPRNISNHTEFSRSLEFQNISISEIESNMKSMFENERIAEILPNLPNFYYFYDMLKECFEGRYYRILRNRRNRLKNGICPGPQICSFVQNDAVKCVHVNAKHFYMHEIRPVTYYFATNYFYSADIGCYPH
ncbi:LOW QUALITY PROTEIN: Protein CBG21996, partial [Caenorhabditis briggsae]